jgi:hypothetical protein
MPDAKWFAMTKSFADYGIECWFNQLLDNPILYQEFRTYFKTLTPDPRNPISTWADESRVFNGWLATHYPDIRKQLIFISKRKYPNNSDCSKHIYTYYAKWRAAAKADRDEEL